MKKGKNIGKIISLLLVISLVFGVLTACSDSKEQAPTEPAPTEAATEAPEGKETEAPEGTETEAPEEKPETPRVAFVLPGTVNDEGWNATAYAGLKMIEEDLGYDVAFSEMVPVSDFTQVYRGYADEGYDLILGHGFQFMDPAQQINEEYPDIWFAVTSTNLFHEPNILSVDTNGTHAGYLNGVIAAMMTETGIVGLPLGAEIPGVLGFEYGFKEAVKATNPDVKVLSTYTGSFEDVTAMKEITKAMIDEGADILAPNGDQGGVGAFQAVNDAKEGVYIMGVYGDQRSLSPDRTLVSAIIDMPFAIESIAELVATGEAEAKTYMFGIREGAVYLTDYDDAVPQDVRDHVADVIAQFESGELDVVRPAD